MERGCLAVRQEKGRQRPPFLRSPPHSRPPPFLSFLRVHPRPYQSIESMAHDLIHTGLCTVKDLGSTSYAKWLKTVSV